LLLCCFVALLLCCFVALLLCCFVRFVHACEANSKQKVTVLGQPNPKCKPLGSSHWHTHFPNSLSNFLHYFPWRVRTNWSLFCFVLFCFVLFCFVLFCFVLFCFVLFFLFISLFSLLDRYRNISTSQRMTGLEGSIFESSTMRSAETYMLAMMSKLEGDGSASTVLDS